jgi:molybdate transport system ATP-binding protein
VLHASLRHQVGEFRLDVALDAERARTLVLVGESGSGKSTILRLLAGLASPVEGRIDVAGAIWCDTRKGVWVPAPERPVGYVAQDYALFPHLSVAENVGFGLAAAGRPAREVRRRTAAMVDRFGLAALADRRPGQLSGGQQQRAALARALALEPSVLLLDEPLSALDLGTRTAVRSELKRLLDGLSCITVFVTHAPMEALLFGDRIAVVEGGSIAQVGDRMSLLREPRSRYIATLLGLNLLPGRVVSRGAGEELHLDTPRGPVTVLQPAESEELFVVVRPDQVLLSREAPSGSARNVFAGVVDEILPEPPYGERVRVVLGPAPAFVAEVSAAAAQALDLGAGTPVYASFKATSISAFA